MRYERPEFLKNEEGLRERVTRLVKSRPDLWPDHLGSTVDSIKSTGSRLMGVSCLTAFSEAELNGPIGIRHWAVYGACHRGYCIDYDGRHDFFKNWAANKWMFPVDYRKERLLVPLG